MRSHKHSAIININNLLIVVSFFMFIGGVFLPFFKSTTFWIFSKDVSIIGSIFLLLDNSDYFLAIITFVFSIIMPISKYLLIITLLLKPNLIKIKTILKHISKWSMTEVFALAIFIIMLKIQGMIFLSIEIKIGAYFFAVAVILSIISTICEAKIIKQEVIDGRVD